MIQAFNRKEGLTSQAGDAESGGGDKAGRQRLQQSRRCAGRGMKVGVHDLGRGPKGVDRSTESRGQRGRQATTQP